MKNTTLITYKTRNVLRPQRFTNFFDDTPNCCSNGVLRLTSLFFDLLEKQFPVSSPDKKISCRFPLDFAESLSVHVNHLNRCLKDMTGKTTSQHIAERITQEAGILLHNSKWNVCEIGYCFGFEEGPHFINFFKKNAKMSPTAYRKMVRSKINPVKELPLEDNIRQLVTSWPLKINSTL